MSNHHHLLQDQKVPNHQEYGDLSGQFKVKEPMPSKLILQQELPSNDHHQDHYFETDKELLNKSAPIIKVTEGGKKPVGPPAYPSPPNPTRSNQTRPIQSNLILNQSKQAKHRTISQSTNHQDVNGNQNEQKDIVKELESYPGEPPKLDFTGPRRLDEDLNEGLSDSSSEEEIGHIIG